MQGEVSRIGGTDAGVLPKYKNDIYIKYLFRDSIKSIDNLLIVHGNQIINYSLL